MTYYIKILFLAVLICNSFSSHSQQYNKYELKGKLNNANVNGRVYLSTGFIDLKYYESSFKQLDTLNNKGEFCFRGKISYPHGVVLAYGDSMTVYYSAIIFIEPEMMNIEINLDSSNVIPFKDVPLINNSKSNDEYINSFLLAMSPIAIREKSLIKQREALLARYNAIIPDSISDKITSSFINLRNSKDSILLNYITNHPNSYVGLWLLIQNFCINGYKQIYYDSYKVLSNSLKTTYSAKILANKLKVTMMSNSIGLLFPQINVYTTKNTKVSIPSFVHEKKYILIDFWASYCGPCIHQFDKLKKIYQQYNSKGFEIIGISIDKKSDIYDCLTLIKEHQLPWRQYLDFSGIEAKKRSINAVPTNYLLDENNKIVAKNISLDELSSCLEKYLK